MKESGHSALRRGRFSMAGQVYVVTAVTVERSPLFLDFAASCAASRCFVEARLLGDSVLLAWVLMPDHAHWLLQIGEPDRLDACVNRLKSASARSANRALNRSGALWAHAYHDRAIRDEEDLPNVARYIVANPLRAGLVRRLGDYPFWDAQWM